MRSKRDWSRGKIRYELEKVGITKLYDLDRAHGLPLGICSATISAPHRKGEEILAALLKRDPWEIWPSRFDVSGKRLRPQPKSNYRQARSAGHCQKRRAA